MSIASNAGQRYRDIRSTEKNDKYISIIFRSTTNPLFYDRFYDVEGKTGTLNKSEATTWEGDYCKNKAVTIRETIGRSAAQTRSRERYHDGRLRERTRRLRHIYATTTSRTLQSDANGFYEDTTKWRERILRAIGKRKSLPNVTWLYAVIGHRRKGNERWR